MSWKISVNFNFNVLVVLNFFLKSVLYKNPILSISNVWLVIIFNWSLAVNWYVEEPAWVLYKLLPTGGEFESFSAAWRTLVWLLLTPLFIGPLKKMRPIHANTVAKAMSNIVKKNLDQVIYESDEIVKIG